MTDTTEQVVEQPAPDANVAPEKEPVADPSPAVNDTDDIATKAKGVGKRIDELTRNWRETERDRDHWRELALKQTQPQQRTEPEASVTEKTLADFEYDEVKYQRYLKDEVSKTAVEAARRELKAEQERNAGAQRKVSFVARETEFAKSVDDYDAITRNPRLPITEAMVEVVEDSDDGPALLYHLGKNPDITAKLAQLPPIAVARELGKIEARLAYERERAKEASKVSKAPAPPPKVDGLEPSIGNVKPDSPDSDKLSDDEWARRRNKQVSRRS